MEIPVPAVKPLVVAAAVLTTAVLALSLPLAAQDVKPVPKDSVRVSIPGCSKGYMFTAGPPSEDQGATAVPEGMHLRMNGPKKLSAEIKAQEGSRIEITGLIKRGQDAQHGRRARTRRADRPRTVRVGRWRSDRRRQRTRDDRCRGLAGDRRQLSALSLSRASQVPGRRPYLVFTVISPTRRQNPSHRRPRFSVHRRNGG